MCKLRYTGLYLISYKILLIAESSSDPAKPELSGLYPDDCGLSNETSTNFGRNYWWCSQLAGQADLPDNHTLSDFVSDLVSRIKQRFENRQMISRHIRALESKAGVKTFLYFIIFS